VGRHKSMIAYLSAHNLSATAATLRTELNMGEDQLDQQTVKKYEGLLEKKWTSIVRLQKKAYVNRLIILYSSSNRLPLDHGSRVPKRGFTV